MRLMPDATQFFNLLLRIVGCGWRGKRPRLEIGLLAVGAMEPNAKLAGMASCSKKKGEGQCATQVNTDNPNYQLSAACRHTLDLIVGRLQSIYDLTG